MIDLAALRQNADLVSGHLGPTVGLLAVVKADAYGHGAVPCARSLERRVWGFAVSLVEEGIELRRGGIQAPILILGSAYGISHRDVVAYRLTPVVSDESDVPRFAHAAAELRVERVAIHLKIDTGMSRLGLPIDRLEKFLETLSRTPMIELVGVCSHLAEADGEDPVPSERQLVRFDEVLHTLAQRSVRASLVHLANSAAMIRFPSSRRQLVRPGLALYGSTSGRSLGQRLGVHVMGADSLIGLRPVLHLQSQIVALRDLLPGAKVSYGGLFEARRPIRIATVPIGYADGYSRRMTGRAEVLVQGRRCKVVGAITMDMCMVDVTGVPEVRIGDPVVLIGAQGEERITVEELAGWADTIPWEILCAISKRVPRIYAGELRA
jgi:alanine racemase